MLIKKNRFINDEGETNKAFADINLFGNITVECKSWAINGVAFQKFEAGTFGSVTQFKTYLSTISSIDIWNFGLTAKKCK